MIDNELTRIIRDRRSIRKYKSEQLTEEQLQTLLECGFLAPSGGNSQNWHVTVVQSQDYLGRLSEANRQNILADKGQVHRFRGQRVLRGSDGAFHLSEGIRCQRLLPG